MKKCYLIVDVQNDFVGGSLGFEGAEQVVLNIAEKLKDAKGDFVFTRDTHFEDYLTTQEGVNLPVIHCQKDSHGWQIDDRLHPYLEGATIFDKSSFGSKDLIHYFETNRYDEVEIMGLVSNICVISSAVLVKTADPETQIVVDRQCTDSFDPELNLKVFDVLQGLQVKVV